MTTRRTTWRRSAAALMAAATTAAACSGVGGNDSSEGTGTPGFDPDCVTVDMAVSPEKVTLLTDLAETFNESDAEVGGQCVSVRVTRKSSGRAATLLTQDWPNPETNGPRPVIWSPRQRVGCDRQRGGRPHARAGRAALHADAARHRHAAAHGRGAGLPRDADRLHRHRRAGQRSRGLGQVRPSRVGPVQAGQDEPQLLDQRPQLHRRRVLRAPARHRASPSRTWPGPMWPTSPAASSRPSSTTATSPARSSATGSAPTPWTALTYTSAVAVEEKSIIDYNSGNPDGELAPGETPRPPKVPLVAVYPKEGTLYSDNPFMVLDAEWVTEEQKQAAALFEDYVQQPENQACVLEYGFRPGNTSMRSARRSCRPTASTPRSRRTCSTSCPKCSAGARRGAAAQVGPGAARDGRLRLDGRPGRRDHRRHKVELAAMPRSPPWTSSRTATRWACASSRPTSATCSARRISTSCRSAPWTRASGPSCASRSRPLPAERHTALSGHAGRGGADPRQLRPVAHQRRRPPDRWRERRRRPVRRRRSARPVDPDAARGEGANAQAVRVFPIAYGDDADTATLRRIAEASNGALYVATNLATINDVFTAVVSNF